MTDATYSPKTFRTNGGDKFIVASGGEFDVESGGAFKIGGVAVTASAAELNEGTGGLPGAVVNSKAAIYDSAGKLYRSSATPAAAGTLISDATVLTAEFNAVTGANGTAGVKLPVAAANEIVVVINTNASSNLLVYPVAASQINALGASNPFTITPGQSATFIGRSATLWLVAAATDTVTGLTATAADLNTHASEAVSVTMATTPASGTCAVQLTFKDAAVATLTHAVAGLLFFSSSTGLAIAAATSNATLTNGAIQELVVGKVDLFITSAAGLLGFTVTAAAGSYYVTIVLPNGKIITTAAIVVNA